MRPAATLLTLAALLAAAPASAQESAGFQGGPSHSGVAAADFAPPLGKRWVVSDIGRPGAPIVHDGRVFVTGDDGLYALDAATGGRLWTVPGVLGRVSATRGQVFHRSGTDVVARDAATGTVNWAAPGPEGNFNGFEPVADGDRVFVGGSDITAYEASSGFELWTHTLGSPSGGLPASDGERVFFNLPFEETTARQRDTGARLWLAGGGGDSSDGVPAVVADGRVWGERQVVDAATGLRPAPWTGGMPVVAGNTIVTVDRENLVARDLEGRGLWQVVLRSRFGDRRFATQPLVVGSAVYVRVDDERLSGYDLATGREVFRSFSRSSEDESSDFPAAGLGLAAGGDRLVVPFPDKLVAYGPGADTAGVDLDPWRRRSAVSVSLSRRKPVDFGDRTTLRAGYKRTVGGEPSDSELLVEADPFPFDGRWQTAGNVRNGFDGYEATVRPERNTRYRIRYTGVDPDALSRPRTLLVDLPFRVKYRYLSRTRLRARPQLTAPAEVVRRGRKVAFYFFRRAERRSTLLDVVRLRRGDKTEARGETVLKVPRSFGRKDVVFGCVIERRDDGFGEFGPRQRSCGNR